MEIDRIERRSVQWVVAVRRSRSMMRGVGLAVGRQPSKLIYTGSIPVPRSTHAIL
jgi:hypothetical protein